MKREIKFRGKRVDNGDWVYGSLIHRPSGVAQNAKEYAAIIIFDKYADSQYNAYLELEVDPTTVGQLHNALTRKAGKEVYVGDIISHGLAEGLGQPSARNQTSPVNDIEFDYGYYTGVRVIGTIHEKGADQ